MVSDNREMVVLPLSDEIGQHRDPDRAAEIAHDIKDRRAAGLLALRKRSAASADKGVMMNGCPIARTSCDQRNCSIPQSCVRNEFIKQLIANRRRPNPTITRRSVLHITNGTSRKI